MESGEKVSPGAWHHMLKKNNPGGSFEHHRGLWGSPSLRPLV